MWKWAWVGVGSACILGAQDLKALPKRLGFTDQKAPCWGVIGSPFAVSWTQSLAVPYQAFFSARLTYFEGACESPCA